MKKTGRNFISLILTVSMLISYAVPLFTLGVLADGETPITESTVEIIADGVCGDNLTWVLESDGTLTVSGEGDMMEMSDASAAPWYPYRDQITSIIVERGVTSISNYAFSGCVNAINVKIHPERKNSGDDVVIKTLDMFVITATPKQSYMQGYNCVSNNGTVSVGIQPLVNGVPYGPITYIRASELGIEDADVENYLHHTVELANYDAETGEYDIAIIGAAPHVYSNKNVVLNNSAGTIKISNAEYNIADSLSNSETNNEIVAFAGDGVGVVHSRMLVTDEEGNVYDGTGQIVAKKIPFAGSDAKYYAALADGYNAGGELLFAAQTVVTEATALEAWGFATDNIEHARYETLRAPTIAAYAAYQLRCFDDNMDGKYDRMIVDKVYLSSYNTTGTDANTVVNNITAAGNNVKLSEITFTDPTVQKTGTVFAYTYNTATKTVNVIETAEVKRGTLTAVDGTRYNLGTNGKIKFVIDGTDHYIASVIGGGQNWVMGANMLGANFIANPDPADGVTTFADFQSKGCFALTDGYDWIDTANIGMEVNYVTFGKLGTAPIILFIEPVATVTPTLKNELVVMTGTNSIDLDDNFENITAKMFVDGVITDTLIENIDSKVVADLNIKEVAALLYNDELFYPGLIYKATRNAEGEYTVLDDPFDPYYAADLAEFGLKDASVAVEGTTVNFKSGVTTVPNYDNKIFTDKGTVFYFIDRSANGYIPGTTYYMEGTKTTVTTYVGVPANATIDLGTEGMIFVDKLGIEDGDFANVVIVYEAAEVRGFSYYEKTSYLAYVPVGPEKVTMVGTAASLGLTDAKYTENMYYKYANAAIDLQTGDKIDIITPEMLDTTNTNVIYELDENNVVIVREDNNGNVLEGRTSKLWMTLSEAINLGILISVDDAVLTYTPFAGANYVVLHDAEAINVVIGIDTLVTSVTAFPIGGDPNADPTLFRYNAEVNGTATTSALINGDKTVYYLASGLADGSVVVLYESAAAYAVVSAFRANAPENVQTEAENPCDITIGNNAFEGCSNLLAVQIYAENVSFGTDVFENTHVNLVIRGCGDTSVEQYASENGHKLVPFDAEYFMPTVVAPSTVDVTIERDSLCEGENTFTVASDRAFKIFVSFDGGKSFERIPTQEITDGEYSFVIDSVSEDVIIRAAIIGDISNDGMFDYHDVSKIYAAFRKKATLDKFVDTDVNGDGEFDYHDISKLYAIFRGKAEFVD